MRAARVLIFAVAAGALALPACGGNGSTAVPRTPTAPMIRSPSSAATAGPSTAASAALEVVGASAAYFLYQPAPAESLEEVAALFGGTTSGVSPEVLAVRNRLSGTAPPLPLLAIPLVPDSPEAPLPARALRAAIEERLPLALPRPEVYDGFRGLLTLRRVELAGGRPADGYLLEFWTTTAPVTKGGAVDAGARFDAPAFAIAAGSLAAAAPFPSGRRAAANIDGARVEVVVPAGSAVAPETIATLLRSWR